MVQIQKNDLINTPDASRLIYGLRDTGYNFPMAVADIIDNSIAANAKNISVDIELKSDGRKFVYFADDGDGMSYEMLKDAMRYGAKERENPASLGKFGLGLKTASSSVCLKFTLISRQSADQPLNKLSWDLEYVKANDRWEMIHEEVSNEEAARFEEYCGEKGTLLIWSKCDRLLKKIYSEPGGSLERAAIARLAKTLTDHLALVYYRFLAPNDTRAETISIYINGETIKGWNPFYPEKSEQVVEEDQQTIRCELQTGEEQAATIRAWILPHKDDCTLEEREKAKISNRGQGFYVFRENRLIHKGDWLGIPNWGSLEPHMSLLRVEFDFNHLLDEAFMVDVKKSRILLDPELEHHVQKLLQPIRREADQRYRNKKRTTASTVDVDHSSANISIGNAPNTKKADILEVDAENSKVVVSNQIGSGIKLKIPVENKVDPSSLYIEASDQMLGGELWEPVLRSASETGHRTGVRINRHHDFYQKIYLRAKNNGYSVQGMDLLLWALSAAEVNYTDEKLQLIFEDLREEVSSNLRKLLRDIDVPDIGDTDIDE
ncbi:ATP-binding protein [Acinetobacter lwoffii]|uniref:ATP-binding protein n=1 Tax=Acinetobacter lwoffii TaxID=28090 RepID=UPI00209A7D15|nr:ATP-binding protein [Acinetobacter lwoffii]MCO8095371.1 ATP-binding protein [Acinetobacter lwoffii]